MTGSAAPLSRNRALPTSGNPKQCADLSAWKSAFLAAFTLRTHGRALPSGPTPIPARPAVLAVTADPIVAFSNCC